MSTKVKKNVAWANVAWANVAWANVAWANVAWVAGWLGSWVAGLMWLGGLG